MGREERDRKLNEWKEKRREEGGISLPTHKNSNSGIQVRSSSQ
jgi:hypothetical protein